jgi:hypothetical protein
VPGGQRVTAPDVVDQYVQPALLVVDPPHQVVDLLGDQVVDRHGDAGAAGRGDQLGGLLDGLRPVDLRPVPAGAAACGVHRGPGRAELYRDLPTGSPRRPRYQGHLSGQ